MKIIPDARESAKEQYVAEEKAFAMAEKAKEFVDKRCEIYHGNLPDGGKENYYY